MQAQNPTLLTTGVAIVDGNQAIRGKLAEVLRMVGYQVIQASSAKELFRDTGAGNGGGPDADVVVVGFSPAGQTGFEAVRDLKAHERWRDSLVILLTPGTSLTERSEAVEAGADDVLVRPFQPQQLLQTINEKLKTRQTVRDKIDRLIKIDTHSGMLDQEIDKLKEYRKDLGVTRKLRKRIKEDVKSADEQGADIQTKVADLVKRGLLPENPDLDKIYEEREKARAKDPKLRRADPDEVDQVIALRQRLGRERAKLAGVEEGLSKGEISNEEKLELLKKEHKKRKQENRARRKETLERLLRDFQGAIRNEEIVQAFKVHGLPYEDFYAAVYLHLELKTKRGELEQAKANAEEVRAASRRTEGLFFKKTVERQTDVIRVQRLDGRINVEQGLIKDATRQVERAYWEFYEKVALAYRRLVRDRKKDNLWMKLFLRYGYISSDERISPPQSLAMLAHVLKKSMSEKFQAAPGDQVVVYFDEYICRLEIDDPTTPGGISPSLLDAASVSQKEAERIEKSEERWRRVRACNRELDALREVKVREDNQAHDLERTIEELQKKQNEGELSADEAAHLRRSKGNLNLLNKKLDALAQMLTAKEEELADARNSQKEDIYRFQEEEVVKREVENLRIRTKQCGGNAFPLDFVRGIQAKYLLSSRQKLLDEIKHIETRVTRMCQRYICVNYKETGYTYRDGPVFIVGLPVMANFSVCLMPKDNREEGHVFLPGQCEAAKLIPVLARGIAEFIYQSNPSFHEEEVKPPKDPDEKDKEKKKIRAMMNHKNLQEDFRMWLSYAKAKARRNVGNEFAQKEQLEKKPIMEFLKRYLRYLKRTLDATTKVTWDYDPRIQIIFENYVE